MNGEGRRIWVLLVVVLVLTMAIAGLLDFALGGIPLDFVFPFTGDQATVAGVLYSAVVVSVAVYVGITGLEELIVERRFSVEFLMSVAALGAVYLGFLFEGATVLLLYSLAEYFEGYIEDRARKTVEGLSGFMPDRATLLIGGVEKSVGVNEVQLDAVVLLRPGERVPLDGVVIEGSSSIDQSLVTGECASVEKKKGDEIFAGTLNLSGVLKMSVKKQAKDTLVSRIVALVVESRKHKASVEKLVDRFARFYIPVVIGLAVITAVAVPSIFGGAFETWLYRSLVLLVISCPSAFVISVPATIFMGIAVAARKGIIVKGGMYIETMAMVKAVIFDKTGTLTSGEPRVHNVNSVNATESRVLSYAAALEQYSHHPLAETIVKKAAEQNLDFHSLNVTDVIEVAGKGILGYVNGTHVAVGNMELMLENGCCCERIEGVYGNDGHMSTCVSIDRSAVATVCVENNIRQNAGLAVGALKKAGLFTCMLTGDRPEIADKIANSIGVDEVHADLFPEDKLRFLNQFKAKYGTVAMVGDGVNDAPALAASDVGIAMGGSGVDVALESADVVLVRDGLSEIPSLLDLSSKTMRIAKENIAVSLVVKAFLGVFGLLGWVPLWFTVASGDDGLTLLVLLNALRLR